MNMSYAAIELANALKAFHYSFTVCEGSFASMDLEFLHLADFYKTISLSN